jgi:chemotaxis protein methyltransferase CheR
LCIPEVISLFELSEKDRNDLSNYIERNYGIQMPASKKTMLQSRLQKRAMQLGYTSIKDYVSYFFSSEGQKNEIDHFATIVSTHKTEFFREIDHFEILKSIILPELIDNDIGVSEPIMFWSSASSTGEEVYSIILTVYHYLLKNSYCKRNFKVIGTDISDNIATFARKGIYSDNALHTIPFDYHPYIMRSKDTNRKAIRIVPELRKFADFRQQNLIDSQYKVQKGIHVIFCRNVLIYFDRYVQETILRKLVNILAPGGFLLIGHSESLSGMDLPIEPVRMTVYRKVS